MEGMMDLSSKFGKVEELVLDSSAGFHAIFAAADAMQAYWNEKDSACFQEVLRLLMRVDTKLFFEF